MTLGVCLVPSQAFARRVPVPIQEMGGGLSTGVIEVQATPAEVRAALLDFGHWSRLFEDVRGSKVQRRADNHAIVEVESRSLGSRQHKLRVWTQLSNRTPFELVNGLGVKLQGEFSFAPVREGTTRVHGSLRTKATGVAGLFVRENSLRTERRTKLSGYLGDLQRRFGGK